MRRNATEILTVLIAALMAACAPNVPPSIDPTSLSSTSMTVADTMMRGPLGITHDSAAAALGLRPLRLAALNEGDSEIRIWSEGVPVGMTRLFRRNGRVSGATSWIWYGDALDPARPDTHVTSDSALRYWFQNQCRTIGRADEFQGCELRLSKQPSWTVLWDSLARLGVWTLPDQSTLSREGILMSDGGGMVIEIRSGARYRSYQYGNPWMYKAVEQQRAAAIYWVAIALENSVVPDGLTREWRGKLEYTPGNRPSFVRCGSKVMWGIEGNLYRVRQLRDEGDTLKPQSFLVKVRGMLAAPGLAAQEGWPYPELLEVRELLTVTRWSEKGCG